MTDSPLQFYNDQNFLFEKNIYFAAPFCVGHQFIFFHFATSFLSGDTIFFPHLKITLMLRYFLWKKICSFARPISAGKPFFLNCRLCWNIIIHKIYLVWPNSLGNAERQTGVKHTLFNKFQIIPLHFTVVESLIKLCNPSPLIEKREMLSNASLMLGQRRRWWANIKPALNKPFVFAGWGIQ